MEIEEENQGKKDLIIIQFLRLVMHRILTLYLQSTIVKSRLYLENLIWPCSVKPSLSIATFLLYEEFS